MKTLFPPIVPTSLPAFNKEGLIKYYFKPSVANSMAQIKHLQMSIVRIDTNKNILNTNTYPLGVIFKKSNEIFYDETKMYYYVEIDSALFPIVDVAYKIQIRLGEDDISGFTTSESLGAWFRNPATLDKLSEWSIVTYVMPIIKPEFGVQNFNTAIENRVDSTGYVFVGYYTPNNPKETLTSYKYNLYTYGNANDKNTWKLIASSGDRFIGQYEKDNMSYTFTRELKEETAYIVTLSIKTKNLYTETKIYKVYSASYPVLEMFNSIDVEPNNEEARMDITIRAKQILLDETTGTVIKYIKDEPGHTSYPNLKGTHAVIKGSIYNEKDVMLNVDNNGIWVCQFKGMISTVNETLEDAYNKPLITLDKKIRSDEDSFYNTRIKLCVIRVNKATATNINLNPAPEWEYRFVLRKEIIVKVFNKEEIILTENKVFRQTSILPKQEYYFYIKEDNGSMYLDVKKTYLSTSSEI